MKHEEFAIWATMKAIPGKEEDARVFLVEAARRLGAESGTKQFYALEIGDGEFAIFNTLADADALETHVSGEVAKWVVAQQPSLFIAPYDITRTKVLGTKAALASGTT